MDFAERLRSMKIQGASNIALGSLKHLLTFSMKKGFGRDFDIECARLLDARPTAVVLYNVIARVRKKRNAREMQKIMKEIADSKKNAAENSGKIFSKKLTVMTHCHSSFEVAALVKNRSMVKNVIVTETRPRNQGVITARELAARKIPVTFIADSAAGAYMDRTDVVMVGADALRKEGVINKIGTHVIATEAREHKKPFYVVTSTFTIDRRKKFVMEYRPPSELGVSIKGVDEENPAFDITPWKYVTAVITEKGVLKPSQVKRLL